MRNWLVGIGAASLIGLAACGGGDDGASVRNLGDDCPSATGASASATAASGSASATGAASGTGSAGASGSASATEC